MFYDQNQSRIIMSYPALLAAYPDAGDLSSEPARNALGLYLVREEPPAYDQHTHTLAQVGKNVPQRRRAPVRAVHETYCMRATDMLGKIEYSMPSGIHTSDAGAPRRKCHRRIDAGAVQKRAPRAQQGKCRKIPGVHPTLAQRRFGAVETYE